MPKIEPPCYRISLWHDGRWRPRITRTRQPMRRVRELIGRGWDRRLILVEKRPGKGIRMPVPDGPRPIVMAGKVVG